MKLYGIEMMPMKVKIVVLLIVLVFGGCAREGVEETLSMAAENREELLKVLKHYKKVDKSPEKYQAAVFLIENMRYHHSQGRLVLENETLNRLRQETDRIYYLFSKGKSISELKSKPLRDSLWHIQQKRKDSLSNCQIPDIPVDNGFYLDCQGISSEFLISHIDNAFKAWKTSKFARHLTFDEFKEYILPYRCVAGGGFHISGEQYNQLFHKYLFQDTSASLKAHIQRYNMAVNGMRDLTGKTQRKNEGDLLDLYSRDFHDCYDIANYGCNIIRACGIPAVVEFNACYRNYGGRHFHCAIYDSTRNWNTFNPESSLPGDGDWAFATTLNVYRQLYGAQKNTPFFVKAENEYVPSILSNPCIKDVTAHLKETVSITLPFKKKTTNRLAYLASFNKSNGGLFPVTWGVIDTLSDSVHFEHAIPHVIYFPVYYPTNDFAVFGDAFYITVDSVKGKAHARLQTIPGTDRNSDSLMTLVINRKFPRKESMLKLARDLVGGQFLGANKGDFSDAKVLYEIKEPPKPYFLDYPLKNRGNYQYYRFQAPPSSPRANISMLEWVTSKSYNYTNTFEVSRFHVITPDAEKKLKNESRLVKLLDADSWDKMKWKSEYDGNMQTAPGGYPSITLWLKSPQVVTNVRFSPKNADNGIKSGDEYELYYWNDGWHYGGACKAKYEYVVFEKIPANKLYWLVNKSEGNEELPFVMIGDKQAFLYHDIIKEAVGVVN